jgi:hypothetical protein
MSILRNLLLALAVAFPLAACGEDESRPYFAFAGGGFIFNYRNADLYYGFVLKRERDAPEGAEIEVTFELPEPQKQHVEKVAIRSGVMQYTFRTPDLPAVEKNRDYVAVVRILDGDRELARYTKSFRTEIETSTLPGEPLVVGPGYEPNPALPPPGAAQN